MINVKKKERKEMKMHTETPPSQNKFRSSLLKKNLFFSFYFHPPFILAFIFETSQVFWQMQNVPFQCQAVTKTCRPQPSKIQRKRRGRERGGETRREGTKMPKKRNIYSETAT